MPQVFDYEINPECKPPTHIKLEKKKIRFGFRSKDQMPLFMIWREYWEDNEIVFTEVLFSIG